MMRSNPIAVAISVLSLIASICAKLVHFELDLTWESNAPDGIPREMILLNGQFPGPALILDFGDDVEFVMNNYLPYNCSIHFHGIEQLHTPWSDGVPGLTQVPTQPGQQFVYRWTATQYGSYMYHAHAQSLVQDGLYGSIYIKPSANEPSPLDQISSDASDIKAMQRAEQNPQEFLISDWSQLTSQQYFAAEHAANTDVYCIQSILINGKGAVNCQTPEFLDNVTPDFAKAIFKGAVRSDRGCLPPDYPLAQGDYTLNTDALPEDLFNGCQATTGRIEKFTVCATDGWFSLNLQSIASITTVTVSIDEHSMWVYSVDGSHIIPQKADSIQISNGERYSVMVKLDKQPKEYTIRIASTGLNQLISGYATLSYKGSKGSSLSIPYVDYAGQNTTASVVPLDETLLVPFPPIKPAAIADTTHLTDLGRAGHPWMWAMNTNKSLPVTYAEDAPLLYNPFSAAAEDSNLTVHIQNGSWVDLVLILTPTDKAPLQPVHPIHKHSTKAFLIGSGSGPFDYSSVAEAMVAKPQSFDLDTPQWRDMFNTPPMLDETVWMVLRYQSVNPGPWLLHCHVQTHLQGGMAIVLMDGVDVWPTTPREFPAVTHGTKVKGHRGRKLSYESGLTSSRWRGQT